MPVTVDVSEAELQEMEEGGGLKKGTLKDRDRMYQGFADFVVKETNGGDVKTLLESEDGRSKFPALLSRYFFSMRITDKDGNQQWPKKNYAEKIKSNIKMKIIEEFQVDITDPILFPTASKLWNAFLEKLVKEGRSETEHHPEVDPVTMEAIYKLLNDVKEALEARETPEFEQKLAKIPMELHQKLHAILQWGAILILMLFEVRRGGEGLDTLKKADFKVVEDKIKKFKSVKHVKSELDKNHAEGTNSATLGCIPFMQFTANFNPGEIFEYYRSHVLDKATKEGIVGGFLFPKPRQPSSKFNIKDKSIPMYEANMKMGKNRIYEMLPALTDAVSRPRQTNHSVRATAIMYMRRAGLSWETIIKITGHKSTVNLVKFYDLKLEAQGLAEVAAAIGQGSRVALGEEPQTIRLETRPEVLLEDVPNVTEEGEAGVEQTEDVEKDQDLEDEFQNDWDISEVLQDGGDAAPKEETIAPKRKSEEDNPKAKMFRGDVPATHSSRVTHTNFPTNKRSPSLNLEHPSGSRNTDMEKIMASTGTMIGNIARGVMEGASPLIGQILKNMKSEEFASSAQMALQGNSTDN